MTANEISVDRMSHVQVLATVELLNRYLKYPIVKVDIENRENLAKKLNELSNKYGGSGLATVAMFIADMNSVLKS